MQDKLNPQPSVAVITSTIGRAELERAILSVQAQTYPCKHYIFVDGKDYAEQAKRILDKYPDLMVTYLPMNTGAGGWTNSSVNAIAPFLVKEDIICYLDDDNWYELNHIENGVKTLLETGADYAFAMRNMYDIHSQYVCEDIIESIGYYENKLGDSINITFTLNHLNNTPVNILIGTKMGHIDTNCYIMKHMTAKKMAFYWHSGLTNDTNVFKVLNKNGYIGSCTKTFSVNYIMDFAKQAPGLIEDFQQVFKLSYEDSLKLGYKMLQRMNSRHLELMNGKYPWELE